MIVRMVSAALLLLLIVSVSGATASSGANVCYATQDFSLKPAAQNTCISASALSVALDSCGSITPGQTCLGAGSVRSVPGSLPLVGTAIGTENIDSLTSVGGSSLVMLKLRAGLPETAIPVQMVLFGDATMTNSAPGVDPSAPTITVRNGPNNILNLRAIPSTEGEVVGSMSWSEALPADGRTANNSWLHVQSENGAAWVFANLVTVEGDMSTLPVLGGFATEPMQGFTLQTTTISCGGGLLVQSNNDDNARLEINGALLTFANSTLLLHSEAADSLTVTVLNGSVFVNANGREANGRAGMRIVVAPGEAPDVETSYAFASLGSVPLALLSPDVPICVAGVGTTSAPLYNRAGATSAAGELTAEESVTATAQTVIDGVTWLQVGQRWVKQSDVQTVGACEALPQSTSATAGSNSSSSQPADNVSVPASDLVPPERSIWQAHTGVDNLTGVCTAPPIAQCDHLAAVSKNANGTITWLGQEPSPYFLNPTGVNTFSYSGRNQLGNANLSLSVTFTSETTWVGTMTIVYDSDSGCTHTFNYTAERIR
jgi:hypothetical protein